MKCNFTGLNVDVGDLIIIMKYFVLTDFSKIDVGDVALIVDVSCCDSKVTVYSDISLRFKMFDVLHDEFMVINKLESRNVMSRISEI